MESPDDPALAGNFVAAIRRNIPKLVGEDVYERALAQLPDAMRDEILSATSVGWASIDAVDTFWAPWERSQGVMNSP